MVTYSVSEKLARYSVLTPNTSPPMQAEEHAIGNCTRFHTFPLRSGSNSNELVGDFVQGKFSSLEYTVVQSIKNQPNKTQWFCSKIRNNAPAGQSSSDNAYDSVSRGLAPVGQN